MMKINYNKRLEHCFNLFKDESVKEHLCKSFLELVGPASAEEVYMSSSRYLVTQLRKRSNEILQELMVEFRISHYLSLVDLWEHSLYAGELPSDGLLPLSTLSTTAATTFPTSLLGKVFTISEMEKEISKLMLDVNKLRMERNQIMKRLQ